MGKPDHTSRPKRLYEVRSNLNGIHIVEVPARHEVVNSSGAFVLKTRKMYFRLIDC